ncbi:uncharacterized protein LOC113288482 [Papaver somniferum]|uniref:uncharacterized protein LOC113288482 n=1 Tax=Papaver somniferum TaxID=3469 RepID=UPI000E703F21|nr:uncharacterized protein LOC113288482 [Papaver somniferum]XP_026393316.1 uncharacterized protein LOC113288482 [Papaver somniferum]
MILKFPLVLLQNTWLVTTCCKRNLLLPVMALAPEENDRVVDMANRSKQPLVWLTLVSFSLFFRFLKKTNHTHFTSISYETSNQRLDWLFMILKFPLLLFQKTWLVTTCCEVHMQSILYQLWPLLKKMKG